MQRRDRPLIYARHLAKIPPPNELPVSSFLIRCDSCVLLFLSSRAVIAVLPDQSTLPNSRCDIDVGLDFFSVFQANRHQG